MCEENGWTVPSVSGLPACLRARATRAKVRATSSGAQVCAWRGALKGSGTATAARARRVISRHGRLRNRISGGLLVGAGFGLALARPR